MTVTQLYGTNPWILCPRPNPQAHLRLFCFPYAGGGASIYRVWPAQLPAEIEVCAIQLPGRENRLRESCFTRIAPLVEALSPALAPYLDRPFAFFGHSLGALIGFELARQIRRQFQLAPVRLFASARPAPHVVDTAPPAYRLSDAALITQLRNLNGTPSAILQHPELMDLLLPILRADFAVNETYVYSPDEPLDTPISALCGLQDPKATEHDVRQWGVHTRRDFRLRTVVGDHFFVTSAQAFVLEAITEDLAPFLRRRAVHVCSA